MATKQILIILTLGVFLGLSLGAQAHSALERSTLKQVSEISGLSQPVAIAATEDGRIFVSETQGEVRLILPDSSDLSDWFSLPFAKESSNPPRFGGLCLGPGFPASPEIYLTAAYSQNDKRYACILILKDVGNKGTLLGFLMDEVEIPQDLDPGRIKIGGDGMIYWALPDDPMGTKAQDQTSFLGKILRINTIGQPPADNPTQGSYIYASGFKMPYGMAWSSLNGAFYVADYGAGNYNGKGPGRDEVNFVEPGKNYGYPLIKGAESQAGLTAPLQNSTSARGWATNGADFVATGKWEGSFIMAGGPGAELLFRFVFDKKDPKKTLLGEELLTRKKGPFYDVKSLANGNFLLLTANSVLEYQL